MFYFWGLKTCVQRRLGPRTLPSLPNPHLIPLGTLFRWYRKEKFTKISSDIQKFKIKVYFRWFWATWPIRLIRLVIWLWIWILFITPTIFHHDSMFYLKEKLNGHHSLVHTVSKKYNHRIGCRTTLCWQAFFDRHNMCSIFLGSLISTPCSRSHISWVSFWTLAIGQRKLLEPALNYLFWNKEQNPPPPPTSFGYRIKNEDPPPWDFKISQNQIQRIGNARGPFWTPVRGHFIYVLLILKFYPEKHWKKDF